MSSEIAASESQRRALEHADSATGRRAGGPGGPLARIIAGIAAPWASLPLPLRLATIAVLGAGAATAVGLQASDNPAAQPAGVAVEIRVVTIVVLIAAGLFAQTSRLQSRMGGLLIGVGLLSSLWLLNGSSDSVLFSLGVVFTGLMPLVFAYLMLVHPTGRLPSRTELRFLWLSGGALAMTV